MKSFSYFNEPSQIVDTETLMRLARKEAALCCIENTVYDLFENPEKHKKLLEEGDLFSRISKILQLIII